MHIHSWAASYLCILPYIINNYDFEQDSGELRFSWCVSKRSCHSSEAAIFAQPGGERVHQALATGEGVADFFAETEQRWAQNETTSLQRYKFSYVYGTGDLDILVENITLKLFAVNDVVYEQDEQVEK